MSEREYEVLIIGSGPAGLSAALNARVRNKSVAVVSRRLASPSLDKAPSIDNYLGVERIGGADLENRFIEQARGAGAYLLECDVLGLFNLGDSFSAFTSAGDYGCKAVVIATGAVQAASIPGESQYVGSGVSYCATCDGPLYRGKRAVVLGYTAHAAEEANFLAEICSQVTFVAVRGGKAEGVPELREEIRVVRGPAKAIHGAVSVTGVEIEGETIPADGVFVIRDSMPAERLIEGIEVADGAIRVNRDMATNIPGAFAAGDCTGRPYQVAKAVGEGQVAGLSAARYVDALPK
ncbi:MAG: NAD(P)/FAD-dependent oxidoreductase [Clostridia bacterium]|nr:NAD(P)/FAD-dependent oxidoreductase [Clostridia bacterium]